MEVEYNRSPQEVQQRSDTYQRVPPFKITQEMEGRKVKHKTYKYFVFENPIPRTHDEPERFYEADNVRFKRKLSGKQLRKEYCRRDTCASRSPVLQVPNSLGKFWSKETRIVQYEKHVNSWKWMLQMPSIRLRQKNEHKDISKGRRQKHEHKFP